MFDDFIKVIVNSFFTSDVLYNPARLLELDLGFIKITGTIQEPVLINSWQHGLIFITYGENRSLISFPESTNLL